MNGVTHTYTYDGNGNITKEIFGSVTRTYEYDKYNRLVRYDDSGLGSTYLYYYDGRGNITSQAKYAYSTDSTENVKSTTPIETKTYAYGYDIWADALTNFNGSSITYDYAMNPTAWTKGRTLSWENEKSLASITDGTNTSTYTYNGDRLRTKKVTGSKTTEYYILDGTYVGEKTTVNGNTYRISYVYDENGAPTGLNIDGSVCYFVKNLQGDVTGLMTSDGYVFANYHYDAWGNVTVTGVNGEVVTNPESYALLNPFRYRGYMYDDETGFYYVSSRYYDPEVGRWLNADLPETLSADFENITQYNLFAYCFNNPVNMSDETGTWPNWAKVAVGAVATVAAVAVTVATGGAAAPILIGVAASTLSGAAVGYVTGGVQGMVDGACDGFMWGGIGALGSSVVSAAPKIAKAAKAAKADPIKKALKQLDSSGLRPGQTEISRSRVMELVDNFDSLKANSSVYSNGGTRFLVDGHHTTVASTILGKGTCVNMGTITSQMPSVTNVYWSKRWYEFGKTVIKIVG